MKRSQTFLTAEWRHLVMANYVIDPAVLKASVPAGTELDSWNGQYYVSVVAFHFLNTRLKGLAIPFHKHFEEINLRFYVRRNDGIEWKRGVVFVKEIVPKPTIAFVARTMYNENYIALPTRHHIQVNGKIQVRYEWKHNQSWNFIEASAAGDAAEVAEGSEQQFISEHYWGYTVQKDGGTKEYQVEHPSWRTWTATSSRLNIDIASLYGEQFFETLTQEPTSVFIADGSEVSVSSGVKL